MAAEKVVRLAPTAQKELRAIWEWNAERYGKPHAVRYSSFLRGRIAELERNYSKGGRVDGRFDLRFILIHRRATGHGHVAVYRFDDRGIEVLHDFHTAQDWQGSLSADEP